MRLEEVLKKYDKLLTANKAIDGTVIIKRISPFSTDKKHIILNIKNKYLGSCKWVIKELIKMDTTRYDLFGQSRLTNKKIRDEKTDRRLHEEVAGMLTSSSFIN